MNTLFSLIPFTYQVLFWFACRSLKPASTSYILMTDVINIDTDPASIMTDLKTVQKKPPDRSGL